MSAIAMLRIQSKRQAELRDVRFIVPFTRIGGAIAARRFIEFAWTDFQSSMKMRLQSL
jgi:hypothetical protein